MGRPVFTLKMDGALSWTEINVEGREARVKVYVLFTDSLAEHTALDKNQKFLDLLLSLESEHNCKFYRKENSRFLFLEPTVRGNGTKAKAKRIFDEIKEFFVNSKVPYRI